MTATTATTAMKDKTEMVCQTPRSRTTNTAQSSPQETLCRAMSTDLERITAPTLSAMQDQAHSAIWGVVA
jgi:hypothetical protein